MNSRRIDAGSHDFSADQRESVINDGRFLDSSERRNDRPQDGLSGRIQLRDAAEAVEHQQRSAWSTLHCSRRSKFTRAPTLVPKRPFELASRRVSANSCLAPISYEKTA